MSSINVSYRSIAVSRMLRHDGTMGKRPGSIKPERLFIGEWVAAMGRRQNEVADAAGLTDAYLSQLVTGRRKNPSHAVLKAIADELGISTDRLHELPPDDEVVGAIRKLDPAILARLMARQRR